MERNENENKENEVDECANYASKDFWNKRFESTSGNFDWYVDWKQLKKYYLPILTESSQILMVGCGNSKLSDQMYNDNYKNIISIDISDKVIEKMSEEYPHLKYIEMDATNMTFKENEFDVCIDKGTLDALLCGEEKIYTSLIKEMFRVIKIGGYVTIITHGEPETRYPLFEYCLKKGSYSVDSKKVGLSFMSNFINSVRNMSEDHSMKNAVKNKNILVAGILDAFINTFDEEDLSEEQRNLKKKIELQLKVKKFLEKNIKKTEEKEKNDDNTLINKSEEDNDKKEERKINDKSENSDENKDNKESNILKKDEETTKKRTQLKDIDNIRRNCCYIYLIKKLKQIDP